MDAMKQTMTDQQTGRKHIVDLLARATKAELQTAFDTLSPAPSFAPLRGPETGLVMVRGRIGGGGAAFNLGEATVSRASVRLSTGEIGHGYRLGTDRAAVTLAAVIDAVAQDEGQRQALETGLLARVAARIADEEKRTEQETAATKVDFFTMVRGED